MLDGSEGELGSFSGQSLHEHNEILKLEKKYARIQIYHLQITKFKHALADWALNLIKGEI